MKAVEAKAKGRIGCPVLFGRQNISNPFRIVLAFLTAKSLSDTTGSILRSVSSICEYCGANDVPAVLEIRNLFLEDSILRPFIHLTLSSKVVDEYGWISFTESAFTKFLALPENKEIERMATIRDRR